MVKQQEISLIACIAQNGAIGFHNHLLYPIRQDMQRFKTLTTGHTVIMGRMTYLPVETASHSIEESSETLLPVSCAAIPAFEPLPFIALLK